MEQHEAPVSETPDDSLITGASLVPEPDEGCFSTCYYVGYTYNHSH